jgi:hypothetical protein
LNAKLAIVDANGTVLAENNGSAVDRKNAALVYTASAVGTIQIHVTTEDGSGAYSLRTQAIERNAVLGRFLIYNNSSFDGDDAAANPQDDGAIALDKVALLPGQTAALANYSSYSRGINGIVIDILGGTPSITAADFEFRVGNTGEPDTWRAAPSPSHVSVRSGAGVAGTDRITIFWPDNAIENEWLSVTMKANANTRLSAPDVFYFGSSIGESGNLWVNAGVTEEDALAPQHNPRDSMRPAEIDALFDYNRDRLVDLADATIASERLKTVIQHLRLITVPGPNTPGAPLAILPGDANFDGRFDSRDLTLVFQSAEYEDDVLNNSTWVEGDWNGDGDFTTRDIIYAFQNGAYEVPVRAIALHMEKSQGSKSLTAIFAMSRPASMNGIHWPAVNDCDDR